MENENVENLSEKKETLSSEDIILLDFYAKWCSLCKEYEQIIDLIDEENKIVKVIKIDVDVEQELTTKYQVEAIPTTIIIKNRKEVNRATGVIRKNDLENMLK